MPLQSTSPWLRIYVQERKGVKKIEIQNNTEIVYSFKDANEAIVEVLDDQLFLEFSLNYYRKCIMYAKLIGGFAKHNKCYNALSFKENKKTLITILLIEFQFHEKKIFSRFNNFIV